MVNQSAHNSTLNKKLDDLNECQQLYFVLIPKICSSPVLRLLNRLHFFARCCKEKSLKIQNPCLEYDTHANVRDFSIAHHCICTVTCSISNVMSPLILDRFSFN